MLYDDHTLWDKTYCSKKNKKSLTASYSARERKKEKKWTEGALLLQLLSDLYAPDKLLSSDLFCDLAKAKRKKLSFQEEWWWNRQKNKDNFVCIILFILSEASWAHVSKNKFHFYALYTVE